MKIGLAKVYYGGNRRWFTLDAACNAEARARLRAHFIRKKGEYVYEEDGNERLVKRVARLLKRDHKRGIPS